MNVIALTEFEKYFEALDKITREKVKEAVIEMEKSTSLNKIHAVKKLANSIYYRKKIGDYRLIFKWNKQKQQIFLYKVIHRKDAYKACGFCYGL
jgi:mRNA-degrading endonuclease RelE of RelBE toxin-antitoxin system